jgi:hypothetical protein
MTLARSRVRVGRDVQIVRETFDGVALEGRARLRPGHGIELVWDAVNGSGLAVRRATVRSWEVAALGSDGPVYRGFCRWE